MICQHCKKGGRERDRERERERLGGCVSVRRRDREEEEEEEGCWQRERFRTQSNLGCGEDTQEKCIPETAGKKKAARYSWEVTASFKSLHERVGLPLTSPGLAGSLRARTHTHIQCRAHDSGTTGSAALCEGFH